MKPILILLLVLVAMADLYLHIDARVINRKYHQLVNCDIPTQIVYGGASSGKSSFIFGQRTVLDMCQTERNFLIARKVAKTIRGSVFNEVEKGINRFQLSQYFDINRSNMTITGPNGSMIAFVGLDDVEKVKSITPPRGIFTDLIVEEATEISENDYNQLTLRLRGLSQYTKRKVMLFNPIYRTHWICKRFFNGQNTKSFRDEKLLILHSTYKDNNFLSPEDVDVIEGMKQISPYHYMVYALGEWGVLGDLIFSDWRVEDLAGKLNQYEEVRNGLDFGFTNDPTAIVKTRLYRPKKEIYVFDELYERGLTNPDIARLGRPILGNETVWCDSAEPKSIAELRQGGLNARGADKGKDSLLYGIQYLQGFSFVIDKNCQNFINEVSTYQWLKDKDGNSINQPIGINDHLMAALRYAYSRDRVSGNYVSWIKG